MDLMKNLSINLMANNNGRGRGRGTYEPTSEGDLAAGRGRVYYRPRR